MKQFIVVYSNQGKGPQHLVYKTVNAPDDAEFKAVKAAMKKTSNGPYTSFYKLIDPADLEQIELKPTQGFEVIEEK